MPIEINLNMVTKRRENNILFFFTPFPRVLHFEMYSFEFKYINNESSSVKKPKPHNILGIWNSLICQISIRFASRLNFKYKTDMGGLAEDVK